MHFFRRFINKSNNNGSQSVLSISSVILPLIDCKVNEIFRIFMNKLINEPPEYIAPAVWGINKVGTLDSYQYEIHQMVEPVVQSAYTLLRIEGLDAAQKFAILSLIRALIISKFVYLMEVVKLRCQLKVGNHCTEDQTLADLEPQGHA